jgi:anti-sigma factor RsiW
MRCGRAQKSLIAALDGELTPRRRQALDRHLAGCAACRGELATTERMLAALDARPAEAPVSVALEQATLRRIRLAADADTDIPWWRRLPLPALVIATAVLVLAVGIVRRTGPVPPPPAPTADRVARASIPKATPRREPQAVARRSAPPSEPPAELAAAPDMFMNLPILSNLDKLEHFEAIQTTTLDDDPGTPNG